MFAVIMAGGEGTRFWPRSRRSHPKQFLNIFGTGTMLQQAYNRIRPSFPPDKILVVTMALSCGQVAEQLPELPKENIIAEPLGRNTAPCVGLAALFIKKRQPDAVMVVLAADHLIQNEPEFRDVIEVAVNYARKTEYIVTLGIQPTHAETGYGYIKMGEPLADSPGNQIYEVMRFTEKPNRTLAREFMETGGFLWNSGMFVWRVDTLLSLIKNHYPELDQGLEMIEASLDTIRQDDTIKKVYEGLTSISIDYALMEKAQKVAVIPCNFGWNDVGSWRSLEDLITPDDHGNVTIGPFLQKDSSNCIISSPDKVVAAIGLKDFIVVTSEDAILICPKERHQEVKDIVELIKAKKMEQFL